MSAILNVTKLGAPPWPTVDPFLFCVHHNDAYPNGNDAMGPDASLAGRNIGMDFEGIDGWRMYHGDVIPGFPRHPHRGFETLTLARRGFIDHSDSLGATARFGHGDVQWMTAGSGIVHSEMFPLVDRSAPNPCELFQIWINLPHEDKMVDPHFTMLWNHTIPHKLIEDSHGRKTEVAVVSGSMGDAVGPPPPPSSWAARPEADVAVWTIQMEPGAELSLPPAREGSNRSLYFFLGASLDIDGEKLERGVRIDVRADQPVSLANGPQPGEVLLLQGRPISEPVAHYGPFVMTTRQEIQQAILDYQRTEYGGWPWPSDGPVHDRQEGRFAVHADGRTERPV